MKSGVYYIENFKTGDYYIGSCLDFEKRRRKHFRELRKGIHANQHLQAAYDRYGDQVWFFRKVEECAPEELLKIEQKHLDQADKDDLYNIRLIAESNFGLKASEETKRKMSEAGKRKVFTDEHRANISKAKKGWAPMKGKKMSEEHKAKIRKSSLKPVYCQELDREFPSAVDAATELQCSPWSIYQSVRTGCKVRGMYSFARSEKCQSK